MRQSVQSVWDMRWTVALAAVVGVFLSPLSMAPMALYDYVRPVVSMRGEIVARDEKSVTIHITGEKQRECKFLGVQGYARTREGLLADVFIKRVDRPATMVTKPAEMLDAGTWKLWPIDDNIAVLVYVQHECSGRVLNTLMAQVNL